jgi:hypothetical protein
VIGTNGRGEQMWRGYRRMNMVPILYKHVCKWKKGDMSKLFQEWEERGKKENDGGVNSTMIYFKNFYICHNAP